MRSHILALKIISSFALYFAIFSLTASHADAAAPAVISKGTAAAGVLTSISPSYPPGVAADDMIFMLVINNQPNGIGAIATPAGFAEAAQGRYSNSSSIDRGTAAIFWQRALGGESGTVSVTRTGDTGADGVFFAQMYRVSGAVLTGNPWDAVTPRYGPGNATITWDAVTVSGAERTLLAFAVQADNIFAGTPAGYAATVTGDATTAGTDAVLQLFDNANVSSDGVVTSTGGVTAGWTTFHVSLRPQADATSYTNGAEAALNFSACGGTGCGGRIGQSITVTGSGFGSACTSPDTAIKIGAYEIPCASVSSWSSTSITFTIPSGVSVFGGSGASGLIVRSGGSDDTTPLEFWVFPDITSVSPSGAGEGREGASITITGNRFDTIAGAVEFRNCAAGPIAASVGTWTDTSISVTVPSGIDDADNLCDISVARAPSTGSKSDTSADFIVLPSITSVAVCTTCASNGAREHASGVDTDGVIQLNGNHLGTAAGTVQFTGGFGSIAAAVHGTAEGACTVAGWASGATSVCVEVPPPIADSAYTGTITLTRTGDSKTDVWTDFRILPRITSNTPTSGGAGSIVKISGNHFCQTGTCPGSGSRSTVSDHVVFGSTQAIEGDFVDQSGGAGTCNGTGPAWTHTEICVRVPSGAGPGSQPTQVRSNSSYLSNTRSFDVSSTQPGAPANLQQYKLDGTSELLVGAGTNETSIILEADISAPTSITMRFEAEVKPIASAFDGLGLVIGGNVTGTSFINQRVTVSGLSSGTQYHWRARVLNVTTLEVSSWVVFGDNPAGNGSADGAPANTDVYVDSAAPAITGACAVNPTAPACNGSLPSDTQAQIRWNTDENATRQVAYGISCGTGGTAAEVFSAMSSKEPSSPSALSSSPHAVMLNALSSTIVYSYKIRASDGAGNISYDPPGTSCGTFETASAQTRIMKTIEVFIQQASTLTLTDAFPKTFDVFVSESNAPRTNIFIRSAYVEISGVSVGGTSGDISIGIDFQAGLSPSGNMNYTLSNPGSGKAVSWTLMKPVTDFFWDCLGCSDVSNTVNITVTGAQSTSLVSAKLVATYNYVP